MHCSHSILYCSIDQSVYASLENYNDALNVNLSALDGSGICDPCEKEPTDAICHMDRQQREGHHPECSGL